jgi:hypothetical protein
MKYYNRILDERAAAKGKPPKELKMGVDDETLDLLLMFDHLPCK